MLDTGHRCHVPKSAASTIVYAAVSTCVLFPGIMAVAAAAFISGDPIYTYIHTYTHTHIHTYTYLVYLVRYVIR
jgi:hypothetical protein